MFALFTSAMQAGRWQVAPLLPHPSTSASQTATLASLESQPSAATPALACGALCLAPAAILLAQAALGHLSAATARPCLILQVRYFVTSCLFQGGCNGSPVRHRVFVVCGVELCSHQLCCGCAPKQSELQAALTTTAISAQHAAISVCCLLLQITFPPAMHHCLLPDCLCCHASLQAALAGLTSTASPQVASSPARPHASPAMSQWDLSLTQYAQALLDPRLLHGLL
jgi:hypothetical protein